jgi:hypothetical protein
MDDDRPLADSELATSVEQSPTINDCSVPNFQTSHGCDADPSLDGATKANFRRRKTSQDRKTEPMPWPTH